MGIIWWESSGWQFSGWEFSCYHVCKLQGKFKKVEEDVTYMNDYIEDAENIHNKLVELEDRSRRNNIRIDGIKEHNKES